MFAKVESQTALRVPSPQTVDTQGFLGHQIPFFGGSKNGGNDLVVVHKRETRERK